ncbi:HAMP domain-containing histidine kinase [Parapedobacter sp. ISTM3]|uniref:sensor histidine kinase n=1 Tax=Parapedobacter sp. ISTM3 TaxID=2800130 RepID=UPI001906785E|nr:HAMP domain-containing sensor histidine kinase [Parapedobacter sp. ISTM3]MBK1438472.1 HAMP domain-containing histidine kinase [Parapedobacter sp. ISTM3]
MKSKYSRSFLALLRGCWQELVGKPGMLPNENRSFNVVSLFMIALVGILIPLNFYLGLPVLAIVLIVTEIMLITMFGLSRYRGLHRTGLHVYAGYSYLLVIFTYFYNDGSAGPALYFFLLTYQLLIAFTSSRLQWVWTILHFLLPVSLLAMEYVNPSVIYNGYDSRGARFADLMTSIPIIVICTFVAASYFRKRYECERAAAEEHAKHIEQQNERIRLQNELLTAANREKVELISILGHDLRNPMNAIIGTLEILTKEELPPDVTKKLKEDLLMAAHNTSDLLNNVLAWVSGQIKGIHPLLTWVEPCSVIERILAVQRYMAEKKGIAIQLSIEKGIKVISDAEMLEVIIRNLISNALKFTPQNGTITLSVVADAATGQCMISVRDDGVGMTDEDVKRIFNGHIQSTYGTESEKGIGLGLFLCRELTLRLNGEIWAESELGKGSVFFLALPLYDNGKANDPVTPRLTERDEAVAG